MVDSRAETESIVGPSNMQDLVLSDDLKPYPYANDPVSCPTFSAGIEDVSELIWPEVMDVVLGWLKDLSEYADERDERRLTMV